MINLLVSRSTIVLENVVIFSSGCLCNLLQGGLFHASMTTRSSHVAVSGAAYQNFGELIIRDVQEFGTVVLGDHKLATSVWFRQTAVTTCHELHGQS